MGAGWIPMVMEPRVEDDYSSRQVEAARRVIVDVMQVLASFEDCLVLVGGWVPDLVIEDSEELHVGSVDVDLALDVEKLNEGRYAEMLKLLIDTRRYQQGEKDFQFVTEVDLNDGEDPIQVDVDFLAPKDVTTEKNNPKLIENFRVLKAEGCQAAFSSPLTINLDGEMISGATNSVSLRVASIPDFLIMKSFALNGRDKPKDGYDICYCLDFYDGGIEELAAAWKNRSKNDKDVVRAVTILKEKFKSVDSYGPMQVVSFHDSTSKTIQREQARRAFELVKQFISLVES
ncbi:MAG: nucleotidyl transferase AbiEii/AbiGii toxin family protein [Verrucomicrobiota bacterium]